PTAHQTPPRHCSAHPPPRTTPPASLAPPPGSVKSPATPSTPPVAAPSRSVRIDHREPSTMSGCLLITQSPATSVPLAPRHRSASPGTLHTTLPASPPATPSSYASAHRPVPEPLPHSAPNFADTHFHHSLPAPSIAAPNRPCSDRLPALPASPVPRAG